MEDNELQQSRPVPDPDEKSYDYPIGVHYSIHDSRLKPVILKSDAIRTYTERDGMTYEEAVEFWEFNMEGTDSDVIAVNDMLTQDEITEALEEQEREE